MRTITALVVCSLVLVGIAGAGVAVFGRGGEESFRYEQSRALALNPATVLSARHVEAFVAKAPEPVAPAQRTSPMLVRCRPGGGAVLRNPWSCTIRYRSGKLAAYRVTVQPNGFYRGVGPGIIEGCCVVTPTSG
ncbi:MAG TPA: hypothetical protein VGI26_04125 [Solirubrobacteraceae bacterium]